MQLQVPLNWMGFVAGSIAAIERLSLRGRVTVNQSKTAVLVGFSAIRCAGCVPDSGATTAPVPANTRSKQPHPPALYADGVVVKPLSDPSIAENLYIWAAIGD
jgi:hypothetical protein